MTHAVYDCFTFFNELELLEIRLSELDEVVDVFVLAEAPTTFQGNPKPLHFQDNRERYAPWAHKIRHLVIADTPQTDNPWEREWHQRDALRRGFADAAPEDRIMISDVDEIPSPASIMEAAASGRFCYFELDLFYVALNLALERPRTWEASYMGLRRDLDQLSDLSTPRRHRLQGATAAAGVLSGALTVSRGGWHFSSVGGVEAILTKLAAFSHTEPHVQALADRELLLSRERARTLFFTDERLASVDPRLNFPKAVMADPERYVALGLVTTDYALSQPYHPTAARSR